MKVLILGSASPYSHSAALAHEFRRQGCEVQIFPLNASRFASLLPAMMRHPWSLVHDNFLLLRTCRIYRPDLIFTEKATNLHPRFLRRIKSEIGSFYFVWYGDNPFHAQVTSINVLKCLPLCDIFYSWGKFLVDALRSAGCPRVEHLPFAYAPDFHPYDFSLTAEQQSAYSADVTFVGAWDPQRQAILERLTKFKLRVCGRQWNESLPNNSPLRKFLDPIPAWGRELSVRFKASRIVLNIMREFNMPSHNFRTMEATGVKGGVLLTPRTREQAELFVENEHLFFYEDIDSLPQRIEELLSFSLERLAQVSCQAHQHTMENHLLSLRIQKILDDFANLKEVNSAAGSIRK